MEKEKNIDVTVSVPSSCYEEFMAELRNIEKHYNGGSAISYRLMRIENSLHRIETLLGEATDVTG